MSFLAMQEIYGFAHTDVESEVESENGTVERLSRSVAVCEEMSGCRPLQSVIGL